MKDASQHDWKSMEDLGFSEEDAKNLARTAITDGGKLRHKLLVPMWKGDNFYFILRPPQGTGYEDAQSAGIVLNADGQGMTMKLGTQLLATSKLMVCDFCVPVIKEISGTVMVKEGHFSQHNDKENTKILANLHPDVKKLLRCACMILAGDEDGIDDEVKEWWDRLGNERGALLTPLQPKDN